MLSNLFMVAAWHYIKHVTIKISRTKSVKCFNRSLNFWGFAYILNEQPHPHHHHPNLQCISTEDDGLIPKRLVFFPKALALFFRLILTNQSCRKINLYTDRCRLPVRSLSACCKSIIHDVSFHELMKL